MVVRVSLVGRVIQGAGFEVRTVSVLAVSGRAGQGAVARIGNDLGFRSGASNAFREWRPKDFFRTGTVWEPNREGDRESQGA